MSPGFFPFLLLASLDAPGAATWPGVGGNPLLEVQIPADVLPPGPAEARVLEEESSIFGHRILFDVVPGSPRDLRIWLPRETFGLPPAWEIVVTSESGETWRERRDVADLANPRAEDSPAPRFLGTPLQLQVLQDAWASLGFDARTASQASFQVQDPMAPLDCRSLAAGAYVVADASIRPDALVRCASDGARVLLVTPDPPAALALLAANERVLWGAGSLAHAPDFPRAASGVLMLGASSDDLAVLRPGGLEASAERPAGSRWGFVAMLLLLAGYVLAIGPVGWLVGIRPRKLLVAWGWFPLVAFVATLGAVAVSLCLRAPPRLEVVTSTVVSPDGQGLRRVTLRLDAPYSASYEISLPWEDYDLASIGYAHHFGSPFGTAARTILLHEDARSGRARLSHVTSAGWNSGAVEWVGEIRVPAPPTLLSREGGIEVFNPGERSWEAGLAVVGGRCARVDAVEAGERRALSLSSFLPCEEGREAEEPPWVGQLRYQVGQPGAQGPRAFVLALSAPLGPADEFGIRPAIEVLESALLVVAGALVEARP